jgi:hypothetical protein
MDRLRDCRRRRPGQVAGRRRRTGKEESCSSGATEKEQGTFCTGLRLCSRGKQAGIVSSARASTASQRGDNDENCQLLLRPTADTLRGRANEGFALPLPGMPAANRQRFRDRRFLQRCLDRGLRVVEHLQAYVRQRLSRRPPLLRHMRLDGLLVSVAEARNGGSGRRVLCRSGFSRTVAGSLQRTWAWLGGRAE